MSRGAAIAVGAGAGSGLALCLVKPSLLPRMRVQQTSQRKCEDFLFVMAGPNDLCRLSWFTRYFRFA